ncbi:MAG TPA: hypothetical protein VH834_00960 [Solirubrobacteraceae bacterium]|jgi:hypothetical protein
MPRRALPLLFLVALGAAAGCGGDNETDHARKAAETYIHDLGARDGDRVCGDMTKALQRQFTETVSRANPEVRGQSCGEIMTLALRSIPYDQLQQFTTAKIENVKVDGSTGSFVYRLRDLKVNGRVAQEGGDWKVSCCVPGQEA